ncbi:hypothetical protein M9H77_25513 [Catharanthus roseus]|uniref:Uncharacterized protein n=1 Tax=Catharanthus roseus TaxID=4058 RepID=A0ACC0A8Y6_CATRO|nr:hypothetical protein M9H77_25513 [Catharanthus roseus]
MYLLLAIEWPTVGGRLYCGHHLVSFSRVFALFQSAFVHSSLYSLKQTPKSNRLGDAFAHDELYRKLPYSQSWPREGWARAAVAALFPVASFEHQMEDTARRVITKEVDRAVKPEVKRQIAYAN